MNKQAKREQVAQGHTAWSWPSVGVSWAHVIDNLCGKLLPQATLQSGDKWLQSKWNLDPSPAPQGTSRPGLSAFLVCTAQRLCSNSKSDCCIFTSWTPKPSGRAETFWHLNVRENAWNLAHSSTKRMSRAAHHITTHVSGGKGFRRCVHVFIYLWGWYRR